MNGDYVVVFIDADGQRVSHGSATEPLAASTARLIVRVLNNELIAAGQYGERGRYEVRELPGSTRRPRPVRDSAGGTGRA